MNIHTFSNPRESRTMGRTLPSLTQAIKEETERLRRVAERVRDERLREKLLKALDHTRELQDAFYDEIADPQEIVLLTLILYMCGEDDKRIHH
ncbi:MAG: DNA polymerase II [Sulfolobaceae archaeon]|nr:DNA polymerase II [Sulfolobaceae archaeon]